MAQNPLLGNRISLISKKNIRYEGTLYSINESDATVALQDVRSFGTEGREKIDPTGGTAFVPPQDTVHPYLVFRGCDIKDLHVHEIVDETPPPPIPSAPDLPVPAAVAPTPTEPTTTDVVTSTETDNTITSTTRTKKPPKPRSNNNTKKPTSQIGTGASLLNRKERGAVTGVSSSTPQDDFDFESNLANFGKDGEEQDDDDGDDGAAYAKDDFFDSISCDAIDKQNGVDNRLRGSTERTLNTETFGAIALNSQRRRRNFRSGGRGNGGGRDNRGGGRGRGRGGRGRGRGRGSEGNNSGSWRSNNPSQQGTTASS